jgi:hypothetical protein
VRQAPAVEDHRLKRDRHDALEEVDDVAGIIGVPVRVIRDARGFVGSDLVALDDPFDR